MSARIPSRRAGQYALSAISHPPQPPPTYITRRYISNPLKDLNIPQPIRRFLPAAKKETPSSANLANPILQKVLENRGKEKSPQNVQPPKQEPAEIDEDTTIFKPEVEIPGFHEGMTEEEKVRLKEVERERTKLRERIYEAELASHTLDPAPDRRRKFESKMVVQSIRHRGRLTHDMKLARTERQSHFRSRELPTSTKKLTKIMNQIAGKTLEEAFVQLRFCKKRAAQDVAKGLAIARDRAVVERGMGLGMIEIPDGTRKIPKYGDPVKIELKDGRRKVVTDPTEMYIDQAWVGKGEAWKSREYRARGRVNILTHRTSTFAVVLKEEKTRIRLSEQIKKKRANRKLWQPLPDRVVQTQRQYCLW